MIQWSVQRALKSFGAEVLADLAVPALHRAERLLRRGEVGPTGDGCASARPRAPGQSRRVRRIDSVADSPLQTLVRTVLGYQRVALFGDFSF